MKLTALTSLKNAEYKLKKVVYKRNVLRIELLIKTQSKQLS